VPLRQGCGQELGRELLGVDRKDDGRHAGSRPRL
jgi:hypothetical protein